MIHISIKVLAIIDHNLYIGFIPFVLNQAPRFAVPLFFLISGFVLELNNRGFLSYKNFFKKRASRVIVPFVFWSLVYTVVFEGFSFVRSLNYNFFYNLINGNASYHLYFIPSLIIFYILFPILHRFVNFLKNPFILMTLLSMELYFLYQDFYVENLDLNENLRIAVLSYSMFVLGMLASHYKDSILKVAKKYFKYLLSSLLLLLVVLIYHIFNLSITNSTTRFIYNQHHPLNYFYTIVFTVTFFYILEKTQFAKKQFTFLSKLTFFVFFIHVLIQHLIWEGLVKSLISDFGAGFLGSFWATPILFIFISTFSFAIAYFVHKIPGASKITG